MQEATEANVSQLGNWVKEDAIYAPNKGIFLTNISHIARHSAEATQAHREGTEFYLTNDQVDECLAGDYVELNPQPIPTNKFAENKITVFAFGEDAEKYGNFLRKYRIKEMPVRLDDMQDKPFALKVWFWDLDNWSGLDGNDRGLYYDRVCGVRKNDAVGAAKKFLQEK